MAAISANARLALALAAGSGAAYLWLNQSKAAEEHLKNHAFVFIKPHAVTDNVKNLVRDQLTAKGIRIIREDDLSAEQIDRDKLIDQHYYSIASKATMLKPTELNVPKDKFQSAFGLSWDDALGRGKVYNAMDACSTLGLSVEEMTKLWANAKKNGKLVKFGGGFYCGEIPVKGQSYYVFNGFFMDMRNNFTAPGRRIHWYDVEWDPKTTGLSWADFRGQLLGPTDPKDAPPSSLRGMIARDWRGLGLKSEPNVGDNGVHASASAFEGMSERMNWLRVPCNQDGLCRRLVKLGIPETVITQWTRDPQVKVDSGKYASLFDSLEDLDAEPTVNKVKEISRAQ
eukprot:TRINITY_DN32554_c0_g1_i1.p1 TRINITY_DN32554_c0_g1~~TRINITY_DN32554_c0_g1_i1.p1  ORF type:complete len:395 (-),score=76.80 TRINITY_DN32554_c0_g1_i1:143-1165(-)